MQAALNNIWSVIPEFKSQTPSIMDLIQVTRGGVSGSALASVAETLQIPKLEIYDLLHMSPKTGQRASKTKLDAEKSDHLIQFIKVLARAMEIFQDIGKALDWLKSPCYALGNQIPYKLLDTAMGVDLVMDTLGRIEYGVFA